MTFEAALARVRARLQSRDQRFLEMVEACIYGNPASPYLPLLRAAGCELGDIQTSVKSYGLEPTLAQLRRDGVFFTFEEFKGREPVERTNVSMEVRPDDFANPKAKRHALTETSGSTGPPTRSWTSLHDSESWLPNFILTWEAHGLVGVPSVWFWQTDPSAVIAAITHSKMWEIDAWFGTRTRDGLTESIPRGSIRKMMAGAARLGGMKLPKIEMVDISDGLTVARWMEKTLRANDKCLLRASVSGAVTVAAAALENGISLEGATMYGTGEPATPAKVATILKTSAKWVPWYAFVEGGSAGTAASIR